MTKIVTFNYLKDSGEKSERVILAVHPATDLYLGFDITESIESDEFQVQQALQKLIAARKTFFDQVYEIGRDYGIQIKTFKKSGISELHDITEEFTQPRSRR